MTLPTQSESWDKTLAELGPRQREVLDAIRRHPSGASAWELSTELRRDVYTVRPRICELFKMGVIREVGTRWEASTYRHETVWGIVLNRAEQLNFDIKSGEAA